MATPSTPDFPTPARPAPGETPTPAKDRMHVGKLVEHGRHPHEFHRNGPPSYYVELLTDQGPKRLWHPGLEAAFKNSRSQPQLGDHVGVRENNLDPVSFISRERNADGVVLATRRVDTPRPRWVVEKLQEFDMRAAAARALRDTTLSRREAVSNHRELLDAFVMLDTGAKMAEERFENPETRRKFVELLRETMARTLERGESLPQLREPAARNRAAPGRTPE